MCRNLHSLLSTGAANVVVRKCKIHNDASVDISIDGTMLAALVPESQAMTMVGKCQEALLSPVRLDEFIRGKGG